MILDQIGSDWIRLDKIDWIRLDQKLFSPIVIFGLFTP